LYNMLHTGLPERKKYILVGMDILGSLGSTCMFSLESSATQFTQSRALHQSPQGMPMTMRRWLHPV
jgi:hypothetical protein